MCGTRENLVEVLDQVLGGTLQAPGSMTLFPQVQLSESKRELTELRSALRVLQKEKEQLQAEKQVRLVCSSSHGCQSQGPGDFCIILAISWLRNRNLFEDAKAKRGHRLLLGANFVQGRNTRRDQGAG